MVSNQQKHKTLTSSLECFDHAKLQTWNENQNTRTFTATTHKWTYTAYTVNEPEDMSHKGNRTSYINDDAVLPAWFILYY